MSQNQNQSQIQTEQPISTAQNPSNEHTADSKNGSQNQQSSLTLSHAMAELESIHKRQFGKMRALAVFTEKEIIKDGLMHYMNKSTQHYDMFKQSCSKMGKQIEVLQNHCYDEYKKVMKAHSDIQKSYKYGGSKWKGDLLSAILNYREAAYEMHNMSKLMSADVLSYWQVLQDSEKERMRGIAQFAKKYIEEYAKVFVQGQDDLQIVSILEQLSSHSDTAVELSFSAANILSEEFQKVILKQQESSQQQQVVQVSHIHDFLVTKFCLPEMPLLHTMQVRVFNSGLQLARNKDKDFKECRVILTADSHLLISDLFLKSDNPSQHVYSPLEEQYWKPFKDVSLWNAAAYRTAGSNLISVNEKKTGLFGSGQKNIFQAESEQLAEEFYNLVYQFCKQ